MCQMLYKAGKQFKWDGLELDYIIVDESEIEAKIAEGWVINPLDTVVPVVAAPAVEAKAPTRAELEQKATELSLKFDGRTSDAKLAALIADALK